MDIYTPCTFAVQYTDADNQATLFTYSQQVTASSIPEKLKQMVKDFFADLEEYQRQCVDEQ